jgi:hypothetical protein
MTKDKILMAKNKKILFLPHAIKQMSRLDRMISTENIQEVIELGEIIEDYPQDERGASCLIAYVNERPIHVVCSPKDDYLAIITAYLPDPKLWSENFKERRK